MFDQVRSAYAALGLEPGAPLAAVRRSYKMMARRWHPDLFSGDPQALAEATIRMRVINRAYQTIREAGPAPALGEPARGAAQPARPDAHAPHAGGLTQEEMDQIVAAMSYRQPFVQRLLDDPGSRGLSLLVVMLHAAVAVIHVVRRDRHVLGDVVVLLLAVVLLRYTWDDDRFQKVLGWMAMIALTWVSLLMWSVPAR